MLCKTHVITTFIFMLALTNISSAQAEFIKYKKYLIPITSGNCLPGPDGSVPKVFYMDDIGEYPEDPNGVLDMPIVLGWSSGANKKIDLVGIGASTPSDGGNYQLAANIMNRSVVSPPPLTTGSRIPQKIIDLANQHGCLKIAIGGPWKYVADAIESFSGDPSGLNSFLSKIAVAGIGSSNISGLGSILEPSRPTSCPSSNFTRDKQCDYYTVKDALAPLGKLEMLDRIDFSQSFPNDRSNDLKFSVLNTRSKRIAVDDWYDSEFLNTTVVGRYIRDDRNPNSSTTTNFIEARGKGGTRWLICGDPCPSNRWGDKNNKGMKMRIADFNAVAGFIWGFDASVFDYGSSMKPKLIESWNELKP